MKNYVLLIILFFCFVSKGFTFERGIYINQSTIENLNRLQQIIQESKKTGINTFVVDLNKITRNYSSRIQLIKNNGIKYVARIVIFPNGGQVQQVRSKAYWERRYRLVEAAINFGADEIQLDYIRYNTKRRPSHQNAQDILEVITYFKQRVAKRNIPLQIDIFGEVAHKPSTRIGQNIKLFAHTVDVVCPMVYPSHYNPPKYHSDRPYQTIDKSLKAMKRQFNHHLPFKLRPYIEATNYRYRMSFQKRVEYISAQIKAVEDNQADGWYVWSPNNQYAALFQALRQNGSAVGARHDIKWHTNNPKKMNKHKKAKWGF